MAIGQAVDVSTPDGVADAYFTRPGGGDAHPGVLLYMDAFGIRPNLCAMADRIADHGYAVLAPNLFYRNGRAPVVALPEFIANSDRPALFADLVPMIAALTPEVAARDAAAHLDWLASAPEVADGPVAITGYCLGGRLAFVAAAAHGDRIAAAASFHGGRLATDAPASPHLRAAGVTAELYFAHADQDPSMTTENIATLESTLSEHGIRYTSELYSGAEHGFTQADTETYDEPAAERHWTALLDLLGRALPGKP
ncbi:dienelactone hydrolase family protein [Nocardia sp. NPDC005978]|uniref:dienelactone hydrolase family protein n=1 Tax=Nocardia sp. NPDC005978 TaxID=3156725 RepID=UPI0033ACAE6D